MKSSLKSLGEFGLISKLIDCLPKELTARLTVGPGDDTSVVRLEKEKYLLLTKDLLLEKVHFELNSLKDFTNLGFKALAVNLSDIAAMGGVPQQALIGLAIPPQASLSQLKAFYRGLSECAQKFHCPIAGGDTNRSRQGWLVSVTVSGYCFRPPLLRLGASPGDSLWVSGVLGAAALGLVANQRKDFSRATTKFRSHLNRPKPRLLLAQRLAKTGKLSAMMDLSDGLASDLQRLQAASQVGFEIELETLPQAKGFRELCQNYRKDPVALALGGGEDYELVFTVKQKEAGNFINWVKVNKLPLTKIGRVLKTDEIYYLKSGKRIRQSFQGFQHF